MLYSIFTNQYISTFEMRAAIGTVVWMAVWWVSSCADYAVTGISTNRD
ncbi:MAG: hypothetical protein R3Y67_10330 [Eubacteriales bacterium]